MKKFERLTYMFVGVAIGFMLFATTNKNKVKTEYDVIEVVKTTDFTDDLDDSEKGYYNHLFNTK
jgi:hypothetical protein